MVGEWVEWCVDAVLLDSLVSVGCVGTGSVVVGVTEKGRCGKIS